MHDLSESPGNDPIIGQVIDGRYLIKARLARGGMAAVYLAEDTRLERPVAVKMMHSHLAESPQFSERFRREARSTAKISHPGIVPVWDQGSYGDQEYLVMELIQGPNLRDRLNRDAPLSVGESLDATRQILSAIRAAHDVGVIHRDLKPENVLIDSHGQLHVTDFGLARALSDTSLSSTGSILGTVGYLSPEVAQSGAIDERSDLYSVGLMLYEMLTGTLPWADQAPLRSAYIRITEDVPPVSALFPELPESVALFVEKLCQRDPAQRFLSATEALNELIRVQDSLTPEQVIMRSQRPNRVAPPDATTSLPAVASSKPLPAMTSVIRTSGSVTGKQPSKVRERAPLLILIALLVVAAVVAGTWWWVRYGPGSYSEIPSVAGLSAHEAESLLEDVGFEAIVQTEFSDTVAEGIVIGSMPEGETRAHRDSVITLYVSAGVKMVDVPVLEGLTKEKATEVIADAGLTLGAVKESWSEDVPANTVISSDPAQGTSVRHDATVGLEVSRGREPIEVPSVIGMNAEGATEEIESLGLIAESSEAYFDDVPAGTVGSQSPSAEEGPLYRGDSVSFTVSLGPELFEVPRVEGKSLQDAKKELEDAGFTVEVNRIAAFFDIVGQQSPAAGEMVRAGSVITLSVV